MSRKTIVDSFGRVHNNLRISVTDRCNIRCFYCMPDENVRFLPRKQILSLEEITRFVKVCAGMGVNKIRLTGGEPLVRSELSKLIEMLSRIGGIEDIAMTTNALLLAEHAQSLKDAGLGRLNISLDTIDPERFEQISRRKGLDKVLNGIQAAKEAGFKKIRINAISIKGLTEAEALPLVKFAREQDLELRFIEFMPLDADQNWGLEQVLTGARLRKIIEAEFGELKAAPRTDLSQPAVDFEFANVGGFANGGRIGFINPVSEPFCSDCNRLRLTAEGMVRNCLFSTSEWNAKELLSGNATDEEIESLILDCVGAKKAAHGIDTDEFARPVKAMYQIGG